MPRIPSLVLWFALSLPAGAALAQSADDGEQEGDAESSVHRQRAAAANAYDRGSEAFLAGEYVDAARWFELANRILPSAAALRQAARAHVQAENIPRAATVAQRLRDAYGEDEANTAIADEILDQHAPSLVRVVIDCEDCSLLLDGAQTDWHDFYVEADAEHEIVAEFETGERTRTIEGKPGQRIDLHLQPPAPPPEESGVSIDGEFDLDRVRDDFRGVPPVVVYVGAAATAVAGGLLIWSTVDMNKDVDEYEDALDAAEQSRNPAALERARELLEDGDKKELRTEILIGTTIGLAAVTATLAALADWSDGSTEQGARLAPRVGLGSLGLSGRF